MRPIVRGFGHLSRRSWTIDVVDVSLTPLAGTMAPPLVHKVDASASTSRSAPTVDRSALHAARLNAVVDMIARLTGRQVKLVPPTAYLVSAPAGVEPVQAVELLAPQGLASQLQGQPGTLEVDITSVLRTGTAQRMRLDQQPAAQLQLRAALDVDL